MPIDPVWALEGYLRAHAYPTHRPEPEPAPILEDDMCPRPVGEQRLAPRPSAAVKRRTPGALARVLSLLRRRPSPGGQRR